MPHRPVLTSLRAKLVVKAALISLLGLCSSSAAQAQAAPVKSTWTVTVDVSGGGNPPTYPVSPNSSTGPCPAAVHQGGSGSRTLYVCSGDTVFFKSDLKSYDLYIYPDGPILVDSSGKPIPLIHVTDHDVNGAGGKINAATSAGKIHEYRVALVDRTSQRLYTDDPQIVIGTGSTFSEIRTLQTNCQTLERSLIRTPDVQKQVHDICTGIDHLARSLGAAPLR